MIETMDSLLLSTSDFHNPVFNVRDQVIGKKVKEIVKDFYLTESKLRKIQQMFAEEMHLGLQSNPIRKSSFLMCNTFVTEFPDRTEEGEFMAMDLGNSNLRIISVKLKPDKQPEYAIEPYHIDVKYRRGTPEQLFDFLVLCIDDFLNKNTELTNRTIPFGLTFSFGFNQISLDKSIITQFSMETDIPEAIGNDAVQYLREALDRKGLSNIEIECILNDTTGVLALGLYMTADAGIGFILGSGTNICYLERIDDIQALDPIKTFGHKPEYVILNTECCSLGDNGSMNFAKTEFDFEIDGQSLFPNSYTLSKSIGGKFIGDIVRRVLLLIARNNAFMAGKITDELEKKDSIEGPDLSSVESDKTDESVIKLLNRLGYESSDITKDDIEIVRYVCALVCVRIALISAAMLSAVVEHMNRSSVKIAIDGSLYKKHPKLHQLITDFIHELIPHRNVELFLSDNGSGIGSALIAAVVNKKRNK